MTTALVVLILLLVVLAIPVTVDYRINWRGKLQGDTHLIWLFGLVHVHIPTESTSTASPTAKTPAKTRHRRRHKTKRKTHPLAAWRLRPFRQRIIRFAQDLWRAIHKRNLRVQLRIGLDDPADTGHLWAFMGPLSACASISQAVDIDIQPDFNESTLELNSSGQVRIIPLQLIGLALGLLLSPSFWHGIHHMRKAG